MAEDFLKGVYDLSGQGETDAYYTEWAATYDEELRRNGYRTPERCADALARFAPTGAPILDIGCGTGISGRALRNVGFMNVVGTDVNAEMLARATSAKIYRRTFTTDLADPFPFEPGTYGAIAAIGVIGVGAAPASLLAAALGALPQGGHLVFSYNDHALAQPVFSEALDDVVASGFAERVFAEHGPHLEGLGSMSTVYVLRVVERTGTSA